MLLILFLSGLEIVPGSQLQESSDLLIVLLVCTLMLMLYRAYTLQMY